MCGLSAFHVACGLTLHTTRVANPKVSQFPPGPLNNAQCVFSYQSSKKLRM